MDWQQILSLIVVAVTGFLLVRSEVGRRRRARRTGCAGNCGCSRREEISAKIRETGM